MLSQEVNVYTTANTVPNRPPPLPRIFSCISLETEIFKSQGSGSRKDTLIHKSKISIQLYHIAKYKYT